MTSSKFRAASRGRAKTSGGGFTLLEVLAAVLVLGLLYTVLANAAMRGLRSEGIDRRRADAEMIADREMTTIETGLSSRVPLVDGLMERDEEPYKVSSNVEPFDVLAALPAQLHNDIARNTDPKAPSVLHDERGHSRLRRITVMVEWDEAGEIDHVERTTFAFDTSAIEELFPNPSESTEGTPEAGLDRGMSTPGVPAPTPGGSRTGPSAPSGRSAPSASSGRSGRAR